MTASDAVAGSSNRHASASIGDVLIANSVVRFRTLERKDPLHVTTSAVVSNMDRIIS